MTASPRPGLAWPWRGVAAARLVRVYSSRFPGRGLSPARGVAYHLGATRKTAPDALNADPGMVDTR